MSEARAESQAMRDEARADDAERFDDAIESIEDADQIAYMLRRLQDENSWLDVWLRDSATHFRSMALKDESGRGRLLVDEFIPRELPGDFGAGSRLRVVSHLDGARVSFDTEVVEPGSQSGAPVYECAQPPVMLYRQRRHVHRSAAGSGTAIEVNLTDASGEALAGRLLDISETGMGIIFDRNTPRPSWLLESPRRAQVDIQSPAGKRLQAVVELRYALPDDADTVSRLGGRFVSLDTDRKRSLLRLVMEVERQAVRRRRRTDV